MMRFIKFFFRAINFISKRSRLLSNSVFLFKQFIIFKKLGSLGNVPDVIKLREIDYKNTIWTSWFQGEDVAPDLVKACFNSFKKNSKKDVIIITKYNLSDYLIIPDLIMSKFAKGLISPTAFSEIVRLELLNTYGGLWLDSTVFLAKNIDNIFDGSEDFKSLKEIDKYHKYSVYSYIPMFCLYSSPVFLPISKIRNIYLGYWLKYNYQVDYHLVDFIFKFIYMKNTYFFADYDSQPVIGDNCYFLFKVSNSKLKSLYLDFIKKDNVGIYKLSNKVVYKPSSGGRPTVLSHFLSGEYDEKH